MSLEEASGADAAAACLPDALPAPVDPAAEDEDDEEEEVDDDIAWFTRAGVFHSTNALSFSSANLGNLSLKSTSLSL
jgi:hypothetical protein